MSYNAVMVAPDGQVYAIDMAGTLLKIDKITGEPTTIGQTPITPQYLSSGIIDPNTGRCFWTVSPASGKSYLYEIDLTNGQGTMIHEFIQMKSADSTYPKTLLWPMHPERQAP